MNRIWGHTLSTAILALAAGSAFPACVHNDGSLFVDGVLFPPTPAGGICTYTASPTAQALSRGLVDAALTDSYTPFFLVGSALIAQGAAATPQAETSRLTLQGVDVRVVDPVDNSQWMNADVLTAATIEPASGSTPSYVALAASIMDATAIAHFNPQGSTSGSKLAEVYVKFYGTTLGGQYIESDEFLYPVDVCYGCLVSFPPGALVTYAPTANPPVVKSAYCSGAVAATTTTVPCIIGQDQPVDCQACYDLSSACSGLIQ
jgi:hypothetical protein